jgi:hypothetical protein
MSIHNCSKGSSLQRTCMAERIDLLCYVLVASTVLITAGCGESGVEPEPPDDAEQQPQVRQLAVGDTVTATAPGSWEFQATVGQDLNLFLQGLTQRDDSFSVELVVDVRTVYQALSTGRDQDLECQASGRFSLPKDSVYSLAVDGPAGATYRMWLYAIDPSPETVAASATGDTVVSEVLDHVGDIDEFTFTAQTGEQFNVFLLTETNDPLSNFRAEVPIGMATGEGLVLSSGADTALKLQATNTFTVPSTGEHTIRVLGEDSRDCRDRGRYRLFLYPINPQPETASGVLNVGDSVLNEITEMMGDVDDFTLGFQDTVEVNFVMEHTSTERSEGLAMRLLTDTSNTQFPNSLAELRYGSGPQLLYPGEDYVLRVVGYGRVYGYYGSYRLHAYRLQRAPETENPVVSIGDTLATEELDPLGDIDEFTFQGNTGQHLSVYFQGIAAPSDWGFQLVVTDLTSDSAIAVGWTGTSQPNLSDRTTGRFTLKHNGMYMMRISAENGGRLAAEVGAYRFLVHELDANPETAAATFNVGDSVTTEAIDFGGDVDEFTLTATPGSSVVFQFQNASGSLTLEVVDPTSREVLGSIDSHTFVATSGAFTVPGSGNLIVRVNEIRNCAFDPTTCAYTYENTGSYWFAAIAQ